MALLGAARVSVNIGSAEVTGIIRDFDPSFFLLRRVLENSVSQKVYCGIEERFLGESAAILLRYTVSIKNIAEGKLFIMFVSLVKQLLL